jgi:hypothetical protein
MFFLVLTVVVAGLVLASCGGPPADTTVADPPKSTVFEKGSNEKINKLIDDWMSAGPDEMKNQKIKPETIEQKLYVSTASLQELADYYTTLTQKGWRKVGKLPDVQTGVLLSGYEIGSTTLVINAVDAGQLGGQGVLVYTLKGTK